MYIGGLANSASIKGDNSYMILTSYHISSFNLLVLYPSTVASRVVSVTIPCHSAGGKLGAGVRRITTLAAAYIGEISANSPTRKL